MKVRNHEPAFLFCAGLEAENLPILHIDVQIKKKWNGEEMEEIGEMAKKVICYAAAFALLCVMFTTCYYFSYQSALKKLNEQSVMQDSGAFAGAAGNPESDYEWSTAELLGETENGSAGTLSASGTGEDAVSGDDGDVVEAGASSVTRVMPYTAYIIETYNVADDTYTTETLRPPADLVGLEREEVEEYFSEYVENMPLDEYQEGLASVELTEFSRKQMTVRKIYNSALVPYQYYLVVRDGYVVVYYSDKQTVFEYTQIAAKDLPIEDQMALSAGIGVEDSGILYSILEGYSS